MTTVEAASPSLPDNRQLEPFSGRFAGLPPLVWHAPLRDPSGYADEARHFLFALERAGADLTAREIRWSDRMATLSLAQARTLRRLMGRPEPAHAVHVQHILGRVFAPFSGVRANVGRTMFETDRLPGEWVAACNRMDAIWVPGEFNRQTFRFAGVEPEKIRVVPGAIDADRFDPGCKPLPIAGRRGYNFLTLFDWTRRKGWDVLLRAYIREFRADEDVALVIKTHSSLGYTLQDIGAQITEFVQHDLGRDLNAMPDIVLDESNVPDAQMPNLYRAADCFVLPTRGEGWGRPIMEAMTLGLPTIATDWSGPTAFMTRDNSLPLDYELADVDAESIRECAAFAGHRWAEPSVSHLQTLMRRAFEDRAEGRAIGERARHDMAEKFSYARVAAILADELERLA